MNPGGQTTKSNVSYDDLRIRIRTGTIEDADRFNEIERACFPSKLRYGPSILVNLVSMVSNYTVLTVQLVKNSKIIAFAVGEQDDDDKTLGRIITIQVDPPYQGRQIGSKLLVELEKKLISEYKVEKFELQVHYKNEKAIGFYQKKHTYEIRKRIRNYYERGEHAFLMVKTISK
ncbi:MAG: GNAT family N-acetyltransferase [Candidatus Heimdallarchaeota archaeon]|nr:MAG: GNAT family N-acetyltransferase [Candidatus Heimdallarchaeota archaeon]